MCARLTRIFFSLPPLMAARRAETRARAVELWAKARSAAGGERLHATRVADEGRHDGDAADEENALHHMHAIWAQIQVAGDGPTAGKGGAEHLGADQNRRAEDRKSTRLNSSHLGISYAV